MITNKTTILTKDPASAKQLSFIDALLTQKTVPVDLQQNIDTQLAAGINRRDASPIIRALLALTDDSAVVEAGVYETPSGEIYVAKWNKAKTNLYAKRLIETGERITETGLTVTIDFQYEPGAIFKLDESMKMPFDKAKDLAIRYGKCFVCGKRLKAKGSVEAGIGPVCARSFA